MSFELLIAAKPDPLEARTAYPTKGVPASFGTITLSGDFSVEASRDVLLAIESVTRDGAESVLVDMEDVVSDDPARLEKFAADLMSLRRSGVHVQVVARGSELHGKLAQLPQSRDWLAVYSANPVTSARRALHLDGPDTAAT